MNARRIRAKLHRLPREMYRGKVDVAVTACIAKLYEPFLEAELVKLFITKLGDAASANRCRVPVYCFMPDHLHLILHGDADDSDTWRAMTAFKQKTGFWFATNRPTIAWLGDFFDHVIRGPDEFERQARYFAENPVRRGLVAQWSDYPFTGAIGFDVREVLAGLQVFGSRRL